MVTGARMEVEGIHLMQLDHVISPKDESPRATTAPNNCATVGVALWTGDDGFPWKAICYLPEWSSNDHPTDDALIADLMSSCSQSCCRTIIPHFSEVGTILTMILTNSQSRQSKHPRHSTYNTHYMRAEVAVFFFLPATTRLEVHLSTQAARTLSLPWTPSPHLPHLCCSLYVCMMRHPGVRPAYSVLFRGASLPRRSF